MAVGVDLANGRVVYKFYNSSASPHDEASWSTTGFEHYIWSDTFRFMLSHKMRGIPSSTYNPQNYNFIASASITAIVIEFPDQEYRPTGYWHHHYKITNTENLSNNIDFAARSDQWLILSGTNINGTKFTHQRSLSSVIYEVETTYGISAYDRIWNGTTKGSTLTAIEYAISGCLVNTSDSGDIYVKNLDPIIGYPDGYGYNGHQTITANINADYVVRRFGPVKHGTSGYEIPMIYCEDGRIANASELNPVVSTYYDLIRWLNKPLPATANYEIMWVGASDVNTPTNTTLGATLSEYINGFKYDSVADYNSRSDYSSYSTALSAYTSSGACDYSGTANNVLIRRYRDIEFKPWEGGSWIKIASTAVSMIENTLTASYSSPSACNYYKQPISVFNMEWGASAYPINVSWENMTFEFLNAHAFDAKTCLANIPGDRTSFTPSLTGIYNVETPLSAVFQWSSYVGKGEKSATGSTAPVGLSGYPANYTDRTTANSVVIINRQGRRTKVKDVIIRSCNVGAYDYGAIRIYGIRSNPSITSWAGFELDNVVIKDIVGDGCQYLIEHSISGSYNKVPYNNALSTWEWPVSGYSVTNCEFNRIGGRTGLGISYCGSPNYVINNLFNNCANLSYAGHRHSYYSGNCNPANPIYFISNTSYNGAVIFEEANFICSGNWVEYNFGINDYEKYKAGSKNGLNVHSGLVNSVSGLLIDNHALNSPEDAILCEGIAPWGHPSLSALSANTAFAGHAINDKCGRLANLTITGNTFSSRNVINKGRTHVHGTVKSIVNWPSTIWLSDTHDTVFDNNIVLGASFEEGKDHGTDEWGQSISSMPIYGFILDSVSGITISNNKIAFTNGLFYIHDGSGYKTFYKDNNYTWWGGCGQYNDIVISGNTIFENFSWMISSRVMPFWKGTVQQDILQTSSEYQNNPQPITSSITAFVLSGRGDQYSDHGGKSRNFKMIDNKFIQYNLPTWTSLFSRKVEGHPSDSTASIKPNGINFETYDTTSHVINDSVSFIEKIIVSDTNWLADNCIFGDDRTTISGNSFYNYDTSTRNIEWLLWKDDPDSYISNTYDINPPQMITSSLVDPYLRYSISATNYLNWKNESKKRNWWFAEQNSFIYTYNGMRLSHIGTSGSKYFFIPKLARIYQTAEDDSLLNLTGWLDYLDTATTGAHGGSNITETSIPNLNYTFDINNPNLFLESISTPSNNSVSALNYASFDEVYQYRRYPRRAITFKNISTNSISGLQFDFSTADFVLWDPLLPTTGAIIPSGEQFTVQFDFQPQSIGNIYGSLNITYIENGIEYTDSITSISGVGIAIPTANYYVATTGSDSNDGSITTPFASLSSAADAATAGQLIFMMGGTYNHSYDGYYSFHFHNTASSWDEKITIMSYPGETATIAPTGDSQYALYLYADTGNKYLSFEDICFDNEMVKISGTATVPHQAAVGKGAVGGNIIKLSTPTKYVRFWNCEIKNYYDDPLSAKYEPSDPIWSSIYDGSLHNRPHIAGVAIGATGVEMAYCNIHDTSEHGIYISTNPSNISLLPTIYGNYIHNLGRGLTGAHPNSSMSALYPQSTSADKSYQSFGIHGNAENYPITNNVWTTSANIYQNLCKTMQSAGILVGGMSDSNVYNNILIDCGGGVWSYYSNNRRNNVYNNISISAVPGNSTADYYMTYAATSNTFSNNISYACPTTGSVTNYKFYRSTQTTPISAFDNWFVNNLSTDSSLSSLTSSTISAYGSGNLYSTDPQMVDPNNNVYNLRSDSPCIRYGYNISSLTSDFYNLERNYNDIGAIEYNYQKISNNTLSALNYASFDEVYQYRRYPRRAITFQNVSASALSGLQFSFTTPDFVIWDSILPTINATIPAGEQFTVQFDFQPQSIGNIYGSLGINYVQNGIEYVQTISSMSGVGIAIPTASYYVATTGSDSNDGSITTPFATIKKAFGLCSSGELIYLREGSYNEHIGTYYGGVSANAGHNTANDWTWNITIAAYPGEEAVIKKSSNGISPNNTSATAMAFFFGLTSEKYFTFEDITFDGIASTAAASASHYLGSCSWHSSYIKFWNCEFKNRHDWGYPTLNGVNRSFNTLLGVSTTGIEFWYCKLHDYDEHGIYVSGSSGDVSPTSPAYGARSACNCKFMYNEIYDGGKNASGQAGFYQSYGFHGNNNNTVETQGSWYRPYLKNNLYVGNYVHNITSGGVLLGGHLSSSAYNSICISCSGGGILDYYSGCSGNEFYNNISISCGSYGARITQSSSSCKIKNNIFYGNQHDYSESNPTNLTITNNITFDNTLSISANNLYSTNPLFVDPNNNVYNLRSDSPCIDYGVKLTDYDFYNLERTNSDIGAIDWYYEVPSTETQSQLTVTGKKRNSNISGGYRSFPNQFRQNTGQLSELQEILDYHVSADTRGKYIETRKQIKQWISQHVDETVFEKQDTFYFLDLVKKIEISKITNNTYWAEQSFEKYIKALAPNSDIHKNIKLNFIKKEEK